MQNWDLYKDKLAMQKLLLTIDLVFNICLLVDKTRTAAQGFGALRSPQP